MTKRTRKINRLKGGAENNNESKPETNETGGFKKKTKKALELIGKSPAMLGLRGRYFVKEEMCQFDINRPDDYRGNKTQDNLRTKLNKCKLFNEDPALKKYMKEKLIDSCKTYHDVTEIDREIAKDGKLESRFSLKYFNHCTNFFECFHDTSELVYLFKDAIEGDKFLEIIIKEKDDEKIRREINEKTQARYKEVVEKGRTKESDNSMSNGEIKREETLQLVMDKRAKEKDDIDLKQELLKNKICDKSSEILSQFTTVHKEIPDDYKELSKKHGDNLNLDIEDKIDKLNTKTKTKIENKLNKGITVETQEKEIYEILIEAIQYVLIEEGNESSYQAKDTSEAITLSGAPEKMNKIKQDFIENIIIPRIEKRIKAIMILRRDIFNEEKAKLEENRNKFTGRGTDDTKVTQLIKSGIKLLNIQINYLEMYERIIKYAFLEAMKKNKMKHLRILIKNKLEDRKKLKKGRSRDVLQAKFDKLEADIKDMEGKNESAKKQKEDFERAINKREILLDSEEEEKEKTKISTDIQKLEIDLKNITFTDKNEIDNLKKERRKLGLQLNAEDIGYSNKKDKERKMLGKLESIDKKLEEFSDRKLDKSNKVIEFKKEYETGISNKGEGKTDAEIREFIEEEIQKEIGKEKVEKNKQTIDEYKTAYIEFIKAEVDKKLYGETETIIKKDDLVSFADKTGEAIANGYNGDLQPLPVQIRYQENGVSLNEKCKILEDRRNKTNAQKANTAADEEEINEIRQQIKAKKRLLVFFINNIFIKNIREYAALNNKNNLEFKDKISRELSKILNFEKYREKIDKLDKDKNYRKNIESLGDINFIDNNMFDEVPIITKNVDTKIEEGKKFFRVRKEPQFGAKENNLYKKLTDNQILKGIFDYYGVLMKAEYLMEKGAIPRDDKYEELKFGPSMFMYVVLGFLASAVGLEFMNYNKNRVGGIGD
jgi:hypothetical protein